MTPFVTLTFLNGARRGKQVKITSPGHCIIGRSDDCDICLPREPGHLDISRHHCELEIDPPAVRVRDLGSLNGTYVNGEKIGQRARYEEPGQVDLSLLPTRELHEGDELQVGDMVMRIDQIRTPEEAPTGQSYSWSS